MNEKKKQQKNKNTRKTVIRCGKLNKLFRAMKRSIDVTSFLATTRFRFELCIWSSNSFKKKKVVATTTATTMMTTKPHYQIDACFSHFVIHSMNGNISISRCSSDDQSIDRLPDSLLFSLLTLSNIDKAAHLINISSANNIMHAHTTNFSCVSKLNECALMVYIWN